MSQAERSWGSVETPLVTAADAFTINEILSRIDETLETEGREVKLEIGSVELSRYVVEKLRELLDDLAYGKDVAVAPADTRVGAEEAARLMGVSTAWFRRRAARGDIRCEMVGPKRKFRLDDLMAFNREDSARRLAAASEALDAALEEQKDS